MSENVFLHAAYAQPRRSPFPIPGERLKRVLGDIPEEHKYVGMVIAEDEGWWWYDPEVKMQSEKHMLWNGKTWLRVHFPYTVFKDL